MTIEEAIIALEEIRGLICLDDPPEWNKAIAMAEDALEKQIAKKPKWVDEVFAHHDWKKDENGEIDMFAYEFEYHNGPVCQRCDESFCIHCEDDIDTKLNEHCICHYYICPTCNERVFKNISHHCRCGQKLDWSKENKKEINNEKNTDFI